MATKIRLQNMHTKEIREEVIGFSWTSLLFGAFVPLIRGDVKWFIVFLVLSFITFGFGWILTAFIYNKIFIKDLLAKGFLPIDDISKHELRQRSIFFADEK